jgi:hypothetical protein
MLLSRKKLEIMANLRKISSDLAENFKNCPISKDIILSNTSRDIYLKQTYYCVCKNGLRINL